MELSLPPSLSDDKPTEHDNDAWASNSYREKHTLQLRHVIAHKIIYLGSVLLSAVLQHKKQ